MHEISKTIKIKDVLVLTINVLAITTPVNTKIPPKNAVDYIITILFLAII